MHDNEDDEVSWLRMGEAVRKADQSEVPDNVLQFDQSKRKEHIITYRARKAKEALERMRRHERVSRNHGFPIKPRDPNSRA